ncbi:MAG: NAD(P)/FAD-dependent oxidoreductase [Planctomycetota bacterium]|jgi:flavin-dependent dehydrogenase|nr:NAD(P)/FAD-dependent oxidoreductase [Planctomycetota bacterium]MDP7254745.1 NAD(P)/FAD-dependent oxidoreductase [Planctomycetota bacterium]
MSTENCEVAIIGGGPAGAALATFLSRHGHDCVILEKSSFPRYHIGESLIPHTHGTFKRLGLLPQMQGSDYPEKYSVRFVSPTGKENDPFYFSETITGDGARTWQVERSTFDRMLLDHAHSSGAQVMERVRVHGVLFDGKRAVGVRAGQNGSSFELGAKVVVDASGRATIIGRQLGLRGEVPGLDKSSLWGYYRGGRRLPGKDAGETTIFLLGESGWFWFIPLPDDIISVGIVSPPEYLNLEQGRYEEILHREIGKCAPLWERLEKATLEGKSRGLKRLSYLNRQTCGEGWVMLGDARAFLDPIYSSGLFLALASAELAADSIHEAIKLDDLSPSALGSFEPALAGGIEVIRRLIHAFYDPTFSFRKFVERFPKHRSALIDCLVGDVLKDMGSFKDSLAEMTPPPPPLG